MRKYEKLIQVSEKMPPDNTKHCEVMARAEFQNIRGGRFGVFWSESLSSGSF